MKTIEKVCVIGSGVMGAAITALIASSSCQVLLLDIRSTVQDNKNYIVEQGLKKLIPILTHPSKIDFITIGNLTDDLAKITECDLVIEVIVENISIKRNLYNTIIPYLKYGAVLSSNTSTYTLGQLTENLPNTLKPNFIITHFFNPPRYMELVELITSNYIESATLNVIEDFLQVNLGKTIIKCKDSVGFIANRIGCFLLELVTRSAINQKLNIVTIDYIFSVLLQFPSTAIFGLYDLIGHDVMRMISFSLTSNLPSSDGYHHIYQKCSILDIMLEQGLIGRKNKAGFYRISIIDEQKVKEVFDFSTLSYRKINDSDIDQNVKKCSTLRDLFNTNSIYSLFMQEVMQEFYTYIFNISNDITDDIMNIETAMVLGYNWKIGPLELLNQHLPQEFQMQIPGMIELPQNLSLSNIPNTVQEKLVFINNSSSLINYNNHLLFRFHTKMNCLNEEVFLSLSRALDYAEENQCDLYIYSSQSKNFSVGGDLNLMLQYIKNKDFTKLENFLQLGQNIMQRLKYSPVNIISCPIGFALGGGSELLLHSDFIIAHAELNAGLVEMKIGLIPAWGGIKEMFMRSKGNKNLLIKNLKNIIMQNKTCSAEYFVLDYSITHYKILMNKKQIINEILSIKMPTKVMSSSNNTIVLPECDLLSEINIAHYAPLQIELINDLQQIINNNKTISEQALLDFEREKFIELAKRKETISMIEQII